MQRAATSSAEGSELPGGGFAVPDAAQSLPHGPRSAGSWHMSVAEARPPPPLGTSVEDRNTHRLYEGA